MPVSITTIVSAEADTAAAVADLRRQLDEARVRPDFIFAFYSGEHDDRLLHGLLADYAPGVPAIGGSSGLGVMSGGGVAGDRSIGLMLVTDPDGAYGAAAAPLGDDPAETARRLLHRALADAGADGELPDLVWVYQAPDFEEAVLAGLRGVLGDRCPVVGGSSASAAEGALMRQLGPEGPLAGGLVVAALFPSGGVSVAYQGGFEPTGDCGVATAPDPGELSPLEPTRLEPSPTSPADMLVRPTPGAANREIALIDGEPAAQVYDRWTGHALPAEALRDGGNIAQESAWFPLGVVDGTIGDLTYFRLVHVNSATHRGSLRTFAAVPDGTRVYAMRGSRSSLVNRAGRVAGSAVSIMEGEGGRPAGALMAYCVGCRMAIGDEIGEVAACARDGFADVPFLGCFTSGEVGPVLKANVHANLMISAVVFGR